MVTNRNPVLAMRERLEKVVKRSVFHRKEPPVPERIPLPTGVDLPDERGDEMFWPSPEPADKTANSRKRSSG